MMEKTISLLCSSILIASICTVNAIDITVTSNQDPTEIGKITLRDAINLINNSEDATNTISFNLGGADTVIFLDTSEGQLPTIINQVTLNGIDQASQEMVFIDGTNIPIEGSEVIHLSGLHFSDNGITSAANSKIQHIGIQNIAINTVNSGSEIHGIFIDGSATNCIVTDCTMQNFINQSPPEVFHYITGISSLVSTRLITNNTIENLISNGISPTRGINCVSINENCNNNTINNLQTSASLSGIAAGNVKGNLHRNTVTNLQGPLLTGITVTILEGNCSHNFVDYLESNDILFGILITQLNGNCSNNTVSDLLSNNGAPVGIRIGQIDEKNNITCNTMRNIKGQKDNLNPNNPSGIQIELADKIVISHNTIDNVTAIEGLAQGIFATALTNSLIIHNTITNISTSNNTGYGINLTDQSTGNDILNNSISGIDGKAINIIDNDGLTDAHVTLKSVTCADGCKLTISGWIIPNTQLISSNKFLLQFFISPNNNPPEAKVLLGQCTHDFSQGALFSVKLNPTIKTQFSQSITATATAILNGTEENNNTSEVSNAIPSCASFSNFCECPEPQPEPQPCPSVECNGFIL